MVCLGADVLQLSWRGSFALERVARHGQEILHFVSQRLGVVDHIQEELSRFRLASAVGSDLSVIRNTARVPREAEIRLRDKVEDVSQPVVVGTVEPPLVGRVAAGSPMLAIENMLGRYPVDPSLFNPRADYLLQVRGLSMRDDGILDGDWLVVHRTTEAKNGQIVVARVGDDVTVKRLKVRGQKAELIPSNPDFKTLHLDLTRETLAIEGIAVGVIRNLSRGFA